MRVTAIIQARMTSTRLPGKVLLAVAEKSLLEYQWNRLARSKQIDQIVIATTVLTSDDPIERWCKDHGVACFRGSELDVLERYYRAAQQFGAQHIVRITSDCPLIDPVVVDQVVARYRECYPSYDYVSNTQERTFPRGMDTEVFSLAALEQAFDKATEPAEREHVTVYLYKPSSGFRLAQVTQTPDWSNQRWTVDTMEDFRFVSLIIQALRESIATATMEEIMLLLAENPEWVAINASVEQKQ